MRSFAFTLVAILTMLAAPASAEEPVLYAPCEDTDGYDAVITLEEGFTGIVTTPIMPLLMSQEDAGSYLLDLSGLEEGTMARVTFMLEWDTPAGLGDYDLIIDGYNAEIWGDGPETHVLANQAHCTGFELATTAYSGTAADTLTLTVGAR